jgi:ABC-type enterochelin transport system substrate-binding protein
MGIEIMGYHVPVQEVDISFYTGFDGDKISFEGQKEICPENLIVMNFPATFQSSWASETKLIQALN